MPRKLLTVGKGVLSYKAFSLEFGIGIYKAERSQKPTRPWVPTVKRKLE